ncbi:MAG: hypothetical protein ACK6AT_13910, partial [Planctomycetota bacterium]
CRRLRTAMNEKHLRTLAVLRYFERWMSNLLDALSRDHGFALSIAANDFMPNVTRHRVAARRRSIGNNHRRRLRCT